MYSGTAGDPVEGAFRERARLRQGDADLMLASGELERMGVTDAGVEPWTGDAAGAFDGLREANRRAAQAQATIAERDRAIQDGEANLESLKKRHAQTVAVLVALGVVVALVLILALVA